MLRTLVVLMMLASGQMMGVMSPSRDFPAYVGQFVGHSSVNGAGATQTFTANAAGANHAIVVFVSNKFTGGTQYTGVTLTATSWTFTQIGSIVTEPTTSLGQAALFCAISPNTSSVTFTVTWTGGSTGTGHNAYQLGDEFSNTNLGGGTSTCNASGLSENSAATTITTSVTPTKNNSVLWGGTLSGGTQTSPGTGFTQGATDGSGDNAQYKITTTNAGAANTVSLTQTSGYFLIGAVAISGK